MVSAFPMFIVLGRLYRQCECGCYFTFLGYKEGQWQNRKALLPQRAPLISNDGGSQKWKKFWKFLMLTYLFWKIIHLNCELPPRGIYLARVGKIRG
jgi:hypothetical protein